jgi:hypothetical protein
MASYLVPIGAHRSIVIRAWNANHAYNRVENRLLLRGDRTTPVIRSSIRELSEAELQNLRQPKKAKPQARTIRKEVGGWAW